MAKNSEKDFLKAFEEYAEALLKHASYRLAGRDRARDLVQETFLKAWDYVQHRNQIRHWKSFLYRVLNNLIIDEYRRSRSESLDALMEEDPRFAPIYLTVDSREEREARLDHDLTMERVGRLMHGLPDTYKTVLRLRYTHGLTPKEIASTLAITENVASVRVHRAIAKLKQMIGRARQ